MPEETPKLVVSSEEVSQVAETAPGPAASSFHLQPPAAPLAPWWAKALLSPLVLALPLLCLCIVILRVLLRNETAKKRAAWLGYATTLLMISGLLHTVALVIFAFRGTTAAPLPTSLAGLDRYEAYPTAPSTEEMDPAEIFAAFKPLLFIVTPLPPFGLTSANYLSTVAIGAGVLIYADDSGYLFATNRHVVEPMGWRFGRGPENSVVLFTSQRESSSAQVVARHKVLDLALMWLDRTLGEATFRQAIASRDEIRVGERVFVLGHPERLFFTMSDGLISRIGENGQVQISAPISPGNSGGPVYDARGNLLAIVSSMMDRSMRPNAQNLNFAVRADALLETEGWAFEAEGADRHKRFVSHKPAQPNEPPGEKLSSLP